MAVIGVDVGGTKISGAIFFDEKMHNKIINQIGDKEGKEVGQIIKNIINKLLEESVIKQFVIEGIGISVPGIYYAKTGEVWAPNIKGWDNYPLLEEVEPLVAKNSIKIKIDSDRACYILGEVWQGSAKNYNDAIFMAVGTGIGAGILINGNILRGSNDIAGAVGWLALDKPFYDKYINYGCFEYNASGDGIARVANELLANKKDYNGILKGKQVTSYDVFDAYDKDDEIAKETIKIAIEFWGMAAANFVSIFNPEVIIFGGGVFGPAVRFIDQIYEEAKKWAQPISIKQVKFLPTSIGSDAGLIGAGYLAIKE
ncbi:MAG TPA: ROK family protein [Ignavibacteriaceae bacterium]|nr:ROK family protein [Ignavibacteriaceae bacterium]